MCGMSHGAAQRATRGAASAAVGQGMHISVCMNSLPGPLPSNRQSKEPTWGSGALVREAAALIPAAHTNVERPIACMHVTD